MDYNPGNSGDRDAIKSDGTLVAFNQQGSPPGCPLTIATWYFPLGGTSAPVPAQTELNSVHLKWSAAFAATITLETSNFPGTVGGFRQGPTDVSDFDATAGNWIQENPSTAVVSVSGAGNSATALTIIAGGTNAGGCTIHIGNLGTKRGRIKIVCTAGGTVRCNVHGKDG